MIMLNQLAYTARGLTPDVLIAGEGMEAWYRVDALWRIR